MAKGSKKGRDDADREVSERDLRKLKRSELLEIMLAQSEEIDNLRKQLAEKDRQLQARTIAIEQSGSIAEAALKLTNVFQEAQAAADLYLDNVKARAAGVNPDAAANAPLAPDAPAENPAAPAPTAQPEAPEHSEAAALIGALEATGTEAKAPKPVSNPGESDAADAADANKAAGARPAAANASDAAAAHTAHAAHADHSFAARETAVMDPITLDNLAARLDAEVGPDATDTLAAEHGSAADAPRETSGEHRATTGAVATATSGAPTAADDVHYEPGQGLKSIEELIDELKVNGAKHRG